MLQDGSAGPFVDFLLGWLVKKLSILNLWILSWGHKTNAGKCIHEDLLPVAKHMESLWHFSHDHWVSHVTWLSRTEALCSAGGETCSPASCVISAPRAGHSICYRPPLWVLEEHLLYLGPPPSTQMPVTGQKLTSATAGREALVPVSFAQLTSSCTLLLASQ